MKINDFEIRFANGLKLTRPPAHWDEYGRPCDIIRQRKGLIEHQNNRLLEDALADGYITSVAEHSTVGLAMKRHAPAPTGRLTR